MIRFAMPGTALELVLCNEAIETLRSRVQANVTSTESVGQLFASSLSSSEVAIRIATVLQPKCARRTRVVIDKALAEAERRIMFENQLHCAGVWHTHPESHPSPSADDNALAEDYARAASDAGVAGIVFIIVGTAPFPTGLYVGIHDGKTMHRATFVES
ncbi:Mov34/MPN/PAD-1 family protein [Paraburkholderia sp. CNPSo 3076]|uniref:Mov34/MPN/PAD-1 family protein n=1 Tax=Paraburkholderia sp. CNPSo 3076 TaxID=2940936 RepID=UPI00225154EA|nr:Mov34/MPN/PAD-1 family protein [Paraburkholderia sp. CNPSo 3076]MCX5545239.1 Mov34/MPN/PAD-1 family protein [Paraburkholderia sp. CNPSo 3076]